MEVVFNPKTGLPEVVGNELSNSDVNDARKIKSMMQTDGWKILQKYLTVGRESIIDAGKDGIRTRAKVALSPEKWAILKGWDECSILPEKIVKRVELFLKTKETAKEEEGKNDENDEG